MPNLVYKIQRAFTTRNVRRVVHDACKRETGMHTSFKRRDYLGDIDVDGRIC
jgi:hypothetical protein